MELVSRVRCKDGRKGRCWGMRFEEAKALFQEDLKGGKCEDDCPECNARELAVSALEKQIPKKPKFYDIKFRQRGLHYGQHTTIEKAYDCPNCNCTVWRTDKSKYCDNCGQALDWSDTE